MTHWINDLAKLGSTRRLLDSDGSNFKPLGITTERQSENNTLGLDCILVSVVGTQGSCPRDTGTRMIVSHDACFGTIGGGHLEYQAIKIAMEMLAADQPSMRFERFPLGARLGQCCGGVASLSFEFIPAQQPEWVNALHTLYRHGEAAVLVSQVARRSVQLVNGRENGKLVVSVGGGRFGNLESPAIEAVGIKEALCMLQDSAHPTSHWQDGLLLESFPANDFHIAVFGAGHVGKALIEILATLPCRVSWIDSRSAEFPDSVPENVQIVCNAHPEDEIDELPEQSQIVVMTHSHALDQTICERALRRGGFAFCGLIGSMAKRHQFEKKLLARGLSQCQWNALSCPIGINGIDGKRPAEIAVAVSAQILQSQGSRQKQTSVQECRPPLAVKC